MFIRIPTITGWYHPLHTLNNQALMCVFGQGYACYASKLLSQLNKFSRPLHLWHPVGVQRSCQEMVKHDQLCKLWNNLWRTTYIEDPGLGKGQNPTLHEIHSFLCLDCKMPIHIILHMYIYIYLYIRSYLYVSMVFEFSMWTNTSGNKIKQKHATTRQFFGTEHLILSQLSETTKIQVTLSTPHSLV